jgi:AraC family transcriptional activator of pobA
MRDEPVPAFVLYGEHRDGRFPDALHIETIAARSSVYDWKIQPHRHQDICQFLAIAAGGGRTRIDGISGILRPGSVVLLPPLVVHEFEFDAGTDGFVASVAKSTTARLFAVEAGLAAALSRPAVLRFAKPAAEFRDLVAHMRAAAAEFSRGDAGRDAALSAHAELIALWFARAIGRNAAAGRATTAPRANLVGRFIEMVEASFLSHRPLPAYAHALGVSVPHLTRTCRQVAGRTAVQIVQDRLMIEARRDLVYTAMPVSQIAFRLGFVDPAYFSRFFAARAGVPPSAYRANG